MSINYTLIGQSISLVFIISILFFDIKFIFRPAILAIITKQMTKKLIKIAIDEANYFEKEILTLLVQILLNRGIAEDVYKLSTDGYAELVGLITKIHNEIYNTRNILLDIKNTFEETKFNIYDAGRVLTDGVYSNLITRIEKIENTDFERIQELIDILRDESNKVYTEIQNKCINMNLSPISNATNFSEIIDDLADKITKSEEIKKFEELLME